MFELIGLFTGILGLLVAITIHEFAHAWMANYLGDPTPRLQKRLTLNPLAHLDPIGTLVLFLTGFRFGWGKPVQFDPYNLENPKRDAALISVAGPISNLILASILSLFFRLSIVETDPLSPVFLMSQVIRSVIFLNVGLAVFNLIPIHPLDGGKILVGLLPRDYAREVDLFLQRYGIMVLIMLLLPLWNGAPLISIITTPIMKFFLDIFLPQSFFI